MPSVGDAQDVCTRCLSTRGLLCDRCALAVLPQLARNIGWLKLMGEAIVEQKGRQRKDAPAPVSPEHAAHLVRKRAARRPSPRRGYRGLAAAIAA